MNVEAWCGSCGENFRLAQVVDEFGGRCPRCGVVYSHEYNAVVTTSSAQLIRAAELLHDAGQQLRDIAPLLHVDREALYKALDEVLDH